MDGGEIAAQMRPATDIAVQEKRAAPSTSASRMLLVRKALARIEPEWLLGVVVVALAFVLDLHMLGTTSVWFDEAFSYQEVNQHFGAMWQQIWNSEPNMELYYLLLYVWIKGLAVLHIAPTEIMLRLPDALFGVASAAMVYAIGRQLVRPIAAFAAAVLYAANPLQ